MVLTTFIQIWLNLTSIDKYVIIEIENDLAPYWWQSISYPEPVYTGWSSIHWNATGMPLVDPVYTGIPLGDTAITSRVHWNTTGET